MSESNSCNQIPYSLFLRNVFYLSQAQKLILYVITPFSLFSALFNALFYIKIPNARQPPADILFCVSLFSAITIIGYLASAIYQNIYIPEIGASVPQNFSSFCIGTGILTLMSEMAQLIYNLVFCFYYIFKIKNPLKSWVNTNRQVHIICILFIFVTVIGVSLGDVIGVSVSGVCALKNGQASPYINVSLSFTYILALIVSSGFFLKYIKKISKTDTNNRVFFKFYFKYLFFICFDKIIQEISLIIIAIFCSQSSDNQQLKIFVLISNITRWITPLIISIIIFSHPQMKTSVLRKLFRKTKKDIHNHRNSFYQDLITTNRTTLLVQLQYLTNQEGFLQRLKQQNRISLLGTILGCITLSNSKKMHQQKFPWNFNDYFEFILDDKIVEQYEDIFVKKMNPLIIKFITYSPSSFLSLRKLDKKMHIGQQLNPHKNRQCIYKNAQTDGGASGQFFLFNYSQQFILKTVSQNELNVILTRIKTYTQYFYDHPQSLIVKIYGAYTAVNPQTNQKIHFILMGNIRFPINKKYTLRTYDLKGSTHKRQVLKQNQFEQQKQLKDITKTLKDKDFQKLQIKVWVNQQDSLKIRKILINDSLFFFQKGLIDYSLIVIKVNYDAFLLDWKKQNPFNNRTMYKSECQPGVVYILGIIDYLQTWNAKKKGEKWYKSLWTKSNEISSQDPEFYSQRFRQNLVKNIF